MSVIEDTRKLIQDFLAPELREISVRLDSLEKQFGLKLDAVDTKIDSLDRRFGTRQDAFEARTADRFTAIEKQFQAIDKRFDAVDKRFDTAERLAADRHTQLLQQLQQINDVNELKIRIARIEAQKVAS